MHPETQHAVDRLRAAVASGEEIKVSPSEAYLLLQAVENFFGESLRNHYRSSR